MAPRLNCANQILLGTLAITYPYLFVVKFILNISTGGVPGRTRSGTLP